MGCALGGKSEGTFFRETPIGRHHVTVSKNGCRRVDNGAAGDERDLLLLHHQLQPYSYTFHLLQGDVGAVGLLEWPVSELVYFRVG